MIKLKGITWDHPRGFDPLEGFSKRNALADIQVEWHKRSLKDFGDTPVEELARKYDLLIIDHPHMGAASAGSFLVNLNDYLSPDEINLLKQQSVGPSMQSYYYNEAQWAIPVDASCQVAAYRPDLLEVNDIPALWEQIPDLSKHLKTKKQYIGMALCATDCNCTFLTLSAQRASTVAAHNGELISLKDGLSVLSVMKMIHEACHPESLHWNPVKLYDTMSSSDEIVYSPLAFAYISYCKPGEEKALRYTLIPGETNALLGGAGIAVSSYSNHISEAVELVRRLCDPQYQQNFYRVDGGQPAMLSAWKDAQANQESGNFFSDVYPTIEKAYMRPRYPSWPAFQEWLGEVIHSYLQKNTDPGKLIRMINQEFKIMFSKH